MEKKDHWLTYDSTIGELYRNPVGHDALARVLLQLGLPIVLLLTICAECFPLLSRFFPLTILSCSLCIFVEIPIFCVSLELLIKHLLGLPYRITWSAVVLTVCVIIDFALVTILAKKRLRNEVRRRLHF